ncbi:hypothetical protein NC651_029143 [Populus alba x Populus x berolinensis]|nr:hypothetical protein NC651_029115 [Populus alba x Populus x berolinensis]KAJ6882739.1 hypothetical protein NC651_029121 [Populus alba x Populus x berolinensis]KAJ6882769.1 hypothetical protein NC651_029143 [Populus alba x Populus x berolinensis]
MLYMVSSRSLSERVSLVPPPNRASGIILAAKGCTGEFAGHMSTKPLDWHHSKDMYFHRSRSPKQHRSNNQMLRPTKTQVVELNHPFEL